MSTRNTIVLSENPRGRYFEGILATAVAKPGTNLKITDTTLVGDSDAVFTDGGEVRVQSVSPGMAAEICVLCEQNLMGGTVDAEQAVGAGVHYYVPLPGDEFQARALSGETLNAGSRATFNADGKLIAAATGILVVQEDAGLLAADTLVMVRVGLTTLASV